ncbi:MAG: FMN-binding protein [Clostridia bacterium]|nr:FMN-binding protein [Clostridia bacterium]
MANKKRLKKSELAVPAPEAEAEVLAEEAVVAEPAAEQSDAAETDTVEAEVYETSEEILREAEGVAPAAQRLSIGEICRIGLPLFVICVAVALVVSFVYTMTADTIAAAALEARNAAIARIFGEDADISELAPLEETDAVFAVDGGQRGYGVSLASVGFGGDINMIVGVDAEGKVCGVEIVTHSETPGFGSKGEDPAYLAQYVGHGAALELGKEIDAISGATVSSRAILAGVNAATAALVEAGLVPEYRTPEPEEEDDWFWEEFDWYEDEWYDEYGDGGEDE